jgi:hypothetical protein
MVVSRDVIPVGDFGGVIGELGYGFQVATGCMRKVARA